MVETIVLIAVCLFVWAKYAKTQALGIKADNKTIQNNYNALLERKEFAQEAQAQDAETYKLAVKLSK